MKKSWVLHFISLLYVTMLLGNQWNSSKANALSVCEGNNVKLFTNTKINQEELRLTLYHNNYLIHVWTRNIPDDTFKDAKQIKRDDSLDIWLHNVSANDQGCYSLLYSKRTNGARREQMNETLVILVPPSPGCKPVINVTQVGEIYYLNATWPEIECDTPHGTVTWTNSQENTSMLRINSTERPGSYTACIKGPAVDCVKDPRVYCSEIYINKSCNSEDEIKPVVIFVIILSSLILTTSIIAAVICYWRIRSQSRKEQFTEEPVYNVTQNGDLPESQVLVKNGHAHQGQEQYKEVPLHNVTQNGDLPESQVLVKNGHAHQEQEQYKEVPLHNVTQNGDLPESQVLAKNGHAHQEWLHRLKAAFC